MPERIAWPPGDGEMAAMVGSHDWAGTPLGPPERWPASLRSTVQLVLGSPLGMIVLWGPELVQIYNDGYRAIMGSKHPAGLGRPTAECWPEVWSFNAPIYDAVLGGEARSFSGQKLVINRRGPLEDSWWDLAYSPLRDDDGRVAGVLVSVVEATARVRGEAMLRNRIELTESRYQALFTSMDEGFYVAEAIFDEAGRCIDILYLEENPAAQRMTGRSFKDRRLSELGNYEQHWRDVFGRVAKTGEAQRMEHFAAAHGIWFDFYVFKQPEAGENRFAVVFRDVTERRRAEQALRASEERFREFGEASGDVLWIRNAKTYEWEYLSKGFEQIFGFSREEALAGDTLKNWLDVVVPADHAMVKQCLESVVQGHRASFEYRIRRPSDGTIRWIRTTGFAMRDEGSDVVRIGGVGSDITDLKAAQEHQRILLAELQHRVRNTLSVVRSMARRTAENSDSVEGMLGHFQGRLDAFSRVQAALTRSPGATVDLASLIQDEMVAHAAKDGKQVSISGPDLQLDPRTAERLSLAIHELTTNAVKHGAFVTADGKVTIRWTREAGDDGEVLALNWTESGVTIDDHEMRESGFGMELLQRSLPYDLRAETSVEFRPHGLHFELRMPLKPASAGD